MDRDNEDIKNMANQLIEVSKIADSAHKILNHIKSISDQTGLSKDEKFMIQAWLDQYTMLAIKSDMEQNKPTIH